jgi:GNAT superfamily N-acetyltransferase
MTSKDPLIRPARPGEAELLSNLALRVKTMRGQARGCIEELKDGECPTDPQLVSEYMRVFVLEQAGSVIGFYTLKLQSKSEIELLALFVEPAYFGKGFWKLLLEDAKSTAVKLGAERLLVAEADPNVVGQYVAAGAAFTGLLESATTAGQTLASFKLDLSSAHVA